MLVEMQTADVHRHCVSGDTEQHDEDRRAVITLLEIQCGMETAAVTALRTKQRPTVTVLANANRTRAAQVTRAAQDNRTSHRMPWAIPLPGHPQQHESAGHQQEDCCGHQVGL